jgi:anhydro-N-acetylmuramic acid kinase
VYCIGLISGTSVDGIDATLVEIEEKAGELSVKLLVGATYPYPDSLRVQILAVCGGAALSMAEFAALDDEIAIEFALAAQKIQAGQPPAEIVGSHGQTVFHRPPLEATVPLGYSLQLGRGEAIAYLTGLPTASNFRAADIAAGGQGAPLVSKVDAYLLSHPSLHRCIQNIGGIGNLTYLPPRQQADWLEKICGWDTGPGNALIDLAVARLTQGRETYDCDGNWAARGTPCRDLVERWLAADFFRIPPPKSTGRELFGAAYLDACWQEASKYDLSEADWLATLTELTAASIALSYRDFLPQMPDEVLLCGGGARNSYLRQRLRVYLPPETALLATDEAGVSSDFKEAIAFAVLGYWRFGGSVAGNLPLVTGAKQPMLLGEIHLPVAAIPNSELCVNNFV